LKFHRKKSRRSASLVTLIVSVLSGLMIFPSQAQVPTVPYAPYSYGAPGYATPYAPGTYAPSFVYPAPGYVAPYSGYPAPYYNPGPYSNYPGYAAPPYDPRAPRANQPALPLRTLPERNLPATALPLRTPLPTGVPEIGLP
jgi:hypothetical protein